MTEVVLASGIFAFLAATVVLPTSLAWTALLALGALVVAVGLGISLVGGACYHLALWRTLGRRGALPRGWIWRPTTLHGLLGADERPGVLLAFAAGVTGVGIVALGCCLVLLAAFAGKTG